MTIEQVLASWGVDRLETTPTHSLVHFARRGDDYVVVKQGDPAARAVEAHALRCYTGTAHARLLAHDPDSGTLLLERVLPGDDLQPLSRQDDDAATYAIAELLLRLHVEQYDAGGLPPLSQIGEAFDAPPDSRVPERMRDRARSQFDDLMADSVDARVLHGDLHHLNVLHAGSGRVRAIDPHGWIGDPVFDTAAMLANPRGLVESGDARGMDGAALAARWDRRIAILAEVTGFDAARIRAWSYVGCVIAELWMIESHDMIHGAPLALAQQMR